MNIIILGPQGSGKGTQAKLLLQRYKLKHLSTGDMIRAGIKSQDPTALKIKEYAAKGNLAPDEVVIELIKNNLSEEGNLFDGFPRTLPQAEALDEIAQINLVIELHIPDEDSIKRLSARRQCKGCNSIFGAFNPPKEEGKCDDCGEPLYQREDDKPEAIKVRLQKYHDETEPLIEYYKPRNIVHKVDGTRTIEEVFEDVCDVIENAAEQIQ